MSWHNNSAVFTEFDFPRLDTSARATVLRAIQVIGYKSHLEGSFSYVDTIDRSVEANFAKISRTKSANFTELGTLDSRASAQVWLERINRDVAQRHWQKEDSEILATGLEQIRTVMGIVMGGGLRNATAYITVQVVMEVLRYDFFRRYEQQHARDVVIMCLNTTRQFLFYTWPALVANLTLNSSDVEASRKLFDDILEGVVDHMNRVHWLELPSRLEATRKVNYSKLSRPPADFVNTYIEAAQLDTLLRREVGNEEYGLYGKLQLEGDVAYMKLWSLRSGAELFLPTLLSKPPLFYPEAGEPFNYGTLGVLVAMALSSAVGHMGARLSASGIEDLWWTDQTLLNYHEATRCYEEQYRRLSNSTASFPEEQRDQVFLWTRAARIAFDRYRLKYKARIARGRERLQHDRVFFMRLCLLTCASREEVGHLWPRFRCHMPLLNMREFSEAFSCRTIDLLAPEKKCPSL
nr:endothelin-converting enzyme homolog [Rhipicephalus microplus]